ncbi:isochorismate synthase, chloroplastic, partial [Genlisea aurea]
SMNGCGGERRIPLGMVETLTMPAVSTPAAAVRSLNAAVSGLKSDPPAVDSGIIRVEVPIEEHVEALEWLRCQSHVGLARCFFSGRDSDQDGKNGGDSQHNLISIAGIGSAVFFRRFHHFS